MITFLILWLICGLCGVAIEAKTRKNSSSIDAPIITLLGPISLFLISTVYFYEYIENKK